MGLWDTVKKIGSGIGSAVKKVSSWIPGGASGAIGSAIGGIPGAVVGGAIDLFGSYLGNQYIGQPNAKDAWKREMESSARAFERSYGAYKTRYQDTVADLKAAGLNPILATGQGINVGTSPQMTAARGYLPQVYDIKPSYSAANIANANLQSTQAQKAETEIDEVISRTEKNWQELYESMERVQKIRAEKGLVKAQERNAWQEFKNVQAKYWQIITQAKLNVKQAMLSVAERRKVAEITKQLIIQIKKLEKSADWYKGAFGSFLGYLKAISESLGLNVGIITGGKIGGK